MAKMRNGFPLLLFLLVAVLSGTAVDPVRAGGWAVVTLDELPADVAVERPFTLRFAVRQHGLRLMEGLTPAVTATYAETGESVTVTATKTGDPGVYAASLTLPATGTWRWSIEAFAATYPMPPLMVRPAAAATSGIWAPAIGVAGALLALGMALAWRRKLNRPRLAGLAAALLIALLGVGWYGQRPLSLAVQFDEAETAVAAERGEALFVAKGCIQ